jgi:hypothetical protein
MGKTEWKLGIDIKIDLEFSWMFNHFPNDVVEYILGQAKPGTRCWPY